MYYEPKTSKKFNRGTKLSYDFPASMLIQKIFEQYTYKFFSHDTEDKTLYFKTSNELFYRFLLMELKINKYLKHSLFGFKVT